MPQTFFEIGGPLQLACQAMALGAWLVWLIARRSKWTWLVRRAEDVIGFGVILGMMHLPINWVFAVALTTMGLAMLYRPGYLADWSLRHRQVVAACSFVGALAGLLAGTRWDMRIVLDTDQISTDYLGRRVTRIKGLSAESVGDKAPDAFDWVFGNSACWNFESGQKMIEQIQFGRFYIGPGGILSGEQLGRHIVQTYGLPSSDHRW